MNDEFSQLMTPFDQYIATESLQMTKLLIPFLPPQVQRMMAVYVKFSEFKLTMSSFRSMKQLSHTPEDIVGRMKPYMSPSDIESFDQMMNMMQMMSMMQEMQGMSGFDPTSMLSGMFTQEEHNKKEKEGETIDGLVESSDASKYGPGQARAD